MIKLKDKKMINTTINIEKNALVESYQPTEKDILCGRGKGSIHHQANKSYISFLRSNLNRYIEAPKRIEKSIVISSIVSSLYDQGYSFIKQYGGSTNTGTKRWYRLSEHEAYERTAHAIRDLIRKGNKKCKTRNLIEMKQLAIVPQETITNEKNQEGYQKEEEQFKSKTFFS